MRPPRRCRPACLLALACLLTATTWAGSVALHIDDPCDPTTLPLRDEPGALAPATAANWLITGRLAMPDFAIADLTQLKLEDASGQPLPLIVESGSVYKDFDTIVGLRIAFELDPRVLAKGLPVLTWGTGVSATNRSVPTLVYAPAAAGGIRGFTAQRAAPAADAARFATIEIIADSHADRYYLWYLLPMGLIFTLLVIRKRWST